MWVKTLQIKNKCVSVNDALRSTTTNRLYNSIVPPGLTYANDHSSVVFHLITWNECKFSM